MRTQTLDPITRDLLAHMRQLDETEAFEEWKAKRLKSYMDDYLYDADIVDAINLVNEGEARSKFAMRELLIGSTIGGITAFNSIMREAATIFAERELNRELERRAEGVE